MRPDATARSSAGKVAGRFVTGCDSLAPAGDAKEEGLASAAAATRLSLATASLSCALRKAQAPRRYQIACLYTA